MTNSTDQLAHKNDEAGPEQGPLAEMERLAEKVKRFRQARRLSLRDLASLTGMSASFLSQLERGKTGASTSTLMQIANALGISVADLFDERATSTHKVLKRSMRPALPVSDGYRKTLLSQRPLHDFEVYVGEFEVGGSTGDELYTHGNSHEMVLVLRGVIQVDLEGVNHVLEEGDSLEYPTSTPHRAANIGNARAEVLWIISPPTTSPQYLDQYVTWKPPSPT